MECWKIEEGRNSERLELLEYKGSFKAACLKVSKVHLVSKNGEEFLTQNRLNVSIY